jgi:hypothetical protein
MDYPEIIVPINEIAQFAGVQLNISPNLFHTTANISLEGLDSFTKGNINVYNTSGVMVKQFKLNANQSRDVYQLNAQDLPSGVYQVQLQLDGMRLTKRIVRLP